MDTLDPTRIVEDTAQIENNWDPEAERSDKGGQVMGGGRPRDMHLRNTQLKKKHTQLAHREDTCDMKGKHKKLPKHRYVDYILNEENKEPVFREITVLGTPIPAPLLL